MWGSEDNLQESSFLIPQSGSHGLSSDRQDWQQVPSPAEPSWQLLKLILLFKLKETLSWTMVAHTFNPREAEISAFEPV